MIYEIFRIIGLVLGYPLQLLFFKRKTYYEDKKETQYISGMEEEYEPYDDGENY